MENPQKILTYTRNKRREKDEEENTQVGKENEGKTTRQKRTRLTRDLKKLIPPPGKRESLNEFPNATDDGTRALPTFKVLHKLHQLGKPSQQTTHGVSRGKINFAGTEASNTQINISQYILKLPCDDDPDNSSAAVDTT